MKDAACRDGGGDGDGGGTVDCLHILHLIGGHVDGNENNKARGAANKYQEEARRGIATRRLTRQRQRHSTQAE